MSEALAIHAVKTQGSASVFLPEQEWKNCSGPFQKERGVSAKNCHFDGLYYGSSACSNTTLASIKKEQAFQNAISNCSNLSNAFEDVCGNCSKAVLGLRDDLLNAYEVKDGNATETGICGIAAVISVLEEKMNNTFSIDNDFMLCMSFLDTFEPGYIKIKYSLAEAILSILIGITAVTLIILLIKFVTKKQPQKPVRSGPITTWSGLYRFSKAEIENAINTERKDLGRGSAGQVYKGHINKSNTSDSFTREVEGLSRVRHPNLVCLFGCCVEDGEQYLVYEYCAEGNLAKHLLRNDPVLTWERRVRILRDCALALRYLHHYIDGCIVHRDIKLTNILLTDNLEPKLSDFGLAKMLGMEESKVFTDVRGTIGYMDPEYMTNAKLTCASDVYSFGIVALQLLSGQKVFELDLDARDQLTRKAKDISMNKRPPEDLEDPRLNGNVNKADFESILQVAVLCVAKSSKGRPTIDLVFEEMDKAWKNTLADMKARNKGISSSATPLSMSSDVFSV
ncbi:leucine-rich repeat receptor-like serine/threonine-protein kinase [Pyrus ussuriensis x Pyrus communis]|uniref:Leucine-rich repeat receptor-like serine/threonine-protein kinase n=1 Tax=Pyrus ussuriensis x Pyrus communis TaxID=2448454 RepID=A0A5N5HUL1_9ROSA|nr:leucine-rich repeat receptor-like serine/threonine-protein kinase [Pyrus ussuriensis x Pyrus communis]